MKILRFLTLMASAAMLLTFVSCSGGAGIAETDDATAQSASDADTASTAVQSESATAAQTEAEPQGPITLRIGSYNIKQTALGGYENIGNVIKQYNLDIVGVQEVDYFNGRHNEDQPKLIAQAAGMPYYYFANALNYQGGQYGTLILSKYPLEFKETIRLTTPIGLETRALGHVRVDVGGEKVDVFNTHLSYERATIRQPQFEKIASEMAKCENFILTGDFNTEDFSEFEILEASLINNTERKHVTDPNGNRSIDNIIYSEAFTEVSSGSELNSYSDHYMLWAEFTLEI